MATKGKVHGQGSGGYGKNASGTATAFPITGQLGFTPKYFIVKTDRSITVLPVTPQNFSYAYTDAYGNVTNYADICYGVSGFCNTSTTYCLSDAELNPLLTIDASNNFSIASPIYVQGSIEWEAVG